MDPQFSIFAFSSFQFSLQSSFASLRFFVLDLEHSSQTHSQLSEQTTNSVKRAIKSSNNNFQSRSRIRPCETRYLKAMDHCKSLETNEKNGKVALFRRWGFLLVLLAIGALPAVCNRNAYNTSVESENDLSMSRYLRSLQPRELGKKPKETGQGDGKGNGNNTDGGDSGGKGGKKGGGKGKKVRLSVNRGNLLLVLS